MPTIVIDDREIEVPPGTKVMEAAERLGIMIPRLCYHPALDAVGACRVCAVMFVKGPLRGLNMSCMVEASEGMEVSTTDEEAVDFRRHVMEWLMLHHPHDCPVCDEGGHCLLQDMTVSGGHGLRRYAGKKRTYEDQDLGPLVQHEMNRCIHCWRCRRFYQEFAGYADLGALQIANRTYFGRFEEGPLESPFAGNLIDLCPTGVYTDKPSRYRGRRWDYQRGDSLCIHCSLGCNTVASVRYRELLRLEARYHGQVNGYFICDRGRYGFAYANHPERPREARIEGKDATWEEALGKAGERLRGIVHAWGPGAVACQGGLRSSLETQGALRRLCRDQGWLGPGFFEDASELSKARAAGATLEPGLTLSLKELEAVDLALVMGADPVNEAPMLALALRQIHGQGGRVVVLDPRPVALPLAFDHVPVLPEELEPCLRALVLGTLARSEVAPVGPSALALYDCLGGGPPVPPHLAEPLARVAEGLRQSRRPALVCGGHVVPETLPWAMGAVATLLKAVKGSAGLFHLLPGANALGGLLLGSLHVSFAAILEAMEAGRVRALVLMESDALWSFPNGARLRNALNRLDLLLVLDYLPSEVTSRAHVFLPTTTVYESGGTFINLEGRAQRVPGVYDNGIPLGQWSNGGHPPRIYGGSLPGGTPRPGWETLDGLGKALLLAGGGLSLDALRAWMIQDVPALAPLTGLDGEPRGVRLELGEGATGMARPPGASLESAGRDDGLWLLLVDWTFGTEELSIHSAIAQRCEPEPFLSIHPEDAGRLGLASGDRVILDLEGGPLELQVTVRANMSPGVIVAPRHRQLPWQRARGRRVRLGWRQIRKAEG